MNIEHLASYPNQATSLLAASRGPDGYADISDGAWERSLAVIKGVHFERIQLASRDVRPNFVACHFEESRFLKITTDTHFWGAGNRWLRCLFSEINLRRVISPQNHFADCIFDKAHVNDYQACETVFTSCKFLSCDFRLLRTVQNRQCGEVIEPELQFIRCEFDQTKFVNCTFRNVVFRDCFFRDPVVENCDFAGIDSDSPWWPKESEADLFVAFLDQTIAILLRRLGNDSKAAEVLQCHRSAYAEGRTSNKDYSADLYTGAVSHDEPDVVEEVLNELGPRFGF